MQPKIKKFYKFLKEEGLFDTFRDKFMDSQKFTEYDNFEDFATRYELKSLSFISASFVLDRFWVEVDKKWKNYLIYQDMPLGDRMKKYERIYEKSINFNKHIVIRIDGHKFSKFTKGFKKPFDDILSKTMIETTKDLVNEFHAVVGYTQSDEITLIIKDIEPKKKHYNKKPKQDQEPHIYKGRVQKIASLASAFASIRFNYHFKSLVDEYWMEENSDNFDYEYGDLLASKIGRAWFDARVFSVPNDDEAFNAILWRVRDAEKNSYSQFAHAYCSHKELHKMNGKEQVQYCKDKTGHDWNKINDRYKYGTFIKKEKYCKVISIDDLGSTQQENMVQRTRLVSYSEHLTYSKENVKFLLNKYKVDKLIDLEEL